MTAPILTGLVSVLDGKETLSGHILVDDQTYASELREKDDVLVIYSRVFGDDKFTIKRANKKNDGSILLQLSYPIEYFSLHRKKDVRKEEFVFIPGELKPPPLF